MIIPWLIGIGYVVVGFICSIIASTTYWYIRNRDWIRLIAILIFWPIWMIGCAFYGLSQVIEFAGDYLRNHSRFFF